MYGRIYKQTFYGSMCGAGAHVHAVWAYCIAHSYPSGTVEINPQLVAFQIGMTPDDVIRAVEFLTSPDPQSRSSEEGGRRLIHLGGFLYSLVNYRKYMSMGTDPARREYLRAKKAESRARAKLLMSTDVNSSQPYVNSNNNNNNNKHVLTNTTDSSFYNLPTSTTSSTNNSLSKDMLVNDGSQQQIDDIAQPGIRPPDPEASVVDLPSCPRTNPKLVAETFNEVLGDVLPRVLRLTEQRKTQIRARSADFFPTIEHWKLYFQTVRASKFLIGENKTGWRATFDWLLQPRNAAKVLEGTYNTIKNPQEPTETPLKPINWDENEEV